MSFSRVHYLRSPRAQHLHAEANALPHERWSEANLVQIVAAERYACELGPAPDSLLPLAMSLQVDEYEFPISDDLKIPTVPYLAYWHWVMQPALQGIAAVDPNRRFTAQFFLSIGSDCDIPLKIAAFVHQLCKTVRKRCDLPVELDDIGFTIKKTSMVSGYVQWRTAWLPDVYEWSRKKGELWLQNAYGPIYYETNSLIISGDTMELWQDHVDTAVRQLTA